MTNFIRRTKIVATLGPSTDDKQVLKKMIQSGATVLRLNFSHGTAEDHINRVKKIRSIEKELNCFVALIGDLQGPKIRISSFKTKNIFLNKGNFFTLDLNIPEHQGDINTVGINYKNLPEEVSCNDILLLDDGKIQLEVIKINNTKIFTKVIVGGYLSNNKGLNKLGGGLSASALTKKDKQDIKLAALLDVDYLAVSFPRSPEDLQKARLLIQQEGSVAKIIAKIERAEAILSDQIIKDLVLASDAIMIARGDLGVEIGDYQLIGIQKKLIKISRQLNRAVITATQMMESMIVNPFPTRAEVMDVANSVLDGTDAVMLSAETASGNFPEITVQTMSKICLGAEKVPSINISKHRLHKKFNSISETISMSAMYAANHLNNVSAVIIALTSHEIALLTSRITSGLPIFYISNCVKQLRLSSLYRGVIPIHIDDNFIKNKITNNSIQLLKDKKLLNKNTNIVMIKSNQKNGNEIVNMFKIIKVT
ncbi:Pyruvate kinase II [Buchnera aphidicola (Cinara kochiana kochiana)]|uniref:Pyruvate kinase n=1 Tax=Buchnera aphidicola (Cinara kochiana kochiana) TaxID=2518976 RepID=A0A451D5R0_9GAMM|nr:pyruvate kinase [Buchnera aphidicola]VFP81123.1 Pyruvate kinase II [Buchnera aphidicola (Cinara kochiana kochiana)]